MFSRIAIGTANWAQAYGCTNEQCKDVKDILDYCQSSGIDTIDTAVAYGDCLKDVNSYFNVVTKIQPGDTLDESRQYYAVLCHHPKDIASVRLKLIDLKKRGICEKIGISVYKPEELSGVDGLDLVQVPYSIFDRRFEESICHLKSVGMEVHTRSAFLQGVAFNPHKLIQPYRDKLLSKVSTVKCFGNLNFLCLAFCLMNPNIDKVIIGTESLEMLKKNLAVFHALDASQITDENILLPYLWKKE